MQEFKESLDAKRLRNSAAGKLISELIEANLLSVKDLENPDVIDLVNGGEKWILTRLAVGDEIFFIDSTSPKSTMFRGIVVYADDYSTLTYNDKHETTIRGIGVRGRYCFPGSRWSQVIQKIIPMEIDIIGLNDSHKIFKITNWQKVTSNLNQFVFES